MTSTEKLLPCPFCGGKAELTGCLGFYWVMCGECCASGAATGEKQATEAWNTRAERTCQMTEIFCGTASGIEWVCSECGSTCFVSEPLDSDEKPRYCPNCGAKVVEE